MSVHCRMILFYILFFLYGHVFSQEHTVSGSCAGVLINGVCWAECNVDSPGTFAATPEAYGMLYQWNRKKGWSATGSVTGWDSSDPIGNSWEAASDPCPVGWRVPAIEEMTTLLENAKVTSTRISQNGVYGRKFMDKATGNVIFFPGVGYRSGGGNLVNNPNYNGWYWSSSSSMPSFAWILYFLNINDLQRLSFPRSIGLTVRCVANRDLTVCDSIIRDTSATICASELPYTWSDTIFQIGTSTGKYRFQRTCAATGCDSIVYLNLTVNPVYSETFNASICAGQSYTEHNFNESTAGTYVQSLQSVSGCDSTITLNLTVNPSYLFTQNTSICEGESYDFRGRILKDAGVYEDTLKTAEGCDSIYHLVLTVRPVYDQTLEAVICEGERYMQNGFDEFVEGDYVRHLQSESGCDSIIRLHLRVERYFDGRMNISLQDCRTHTYRFEAESKNAGPGITYFYKWDTGDGAIASSEEVTHSYADSGYYRIGLTVVTGGGCRKALYDFLKVPYYSNEFTIYSDKESVEPETPTISVWTDCLDGMRYEWDMGDGTILQDCRVTHTYEIGDKTHYDIRLLVLNVEDCPAEQEFRVMSYKAIKTVNTFSPNGDGLNDVFMAGYKIKIINRNGLIVFEGDNGWDGTCKDASVPEDTYFYEIRYRSELGERVKTGYITVVK